MGSAVQFVGEEESSMWFNTPSILVLVRLITLDRVTSINYRWKLIKKKEVLC